MNKLLISILIILLNNSCNTVQNRDKESYIKEDELINQLLWELIITIPPCNNQNMSQEENEIYWSEYYSEMESGKFEVYMKDSLIIPDKNEFDPIDTSTESGKLLTDFLAGLPKESRKFEVPKNPSIFNIRIITDFQTDPSIKSMVANENFLAELRFSRVTFDAENNKAFFTQSIRRNECYNVYLICAQYQQSNWRVMRKINVHQN
ncbi:MAG: hypothetical protein AB9888_03315 [Bacteroidales bacterium]